MVKRIAKKEGRTLAQRRAPTIFNLVCNDKDRLTQMERSGVYSIPIEDVVTEEKAAYVGVTSRTLATRIDEHRRDVRKGNINTALAMEAYARDLDIKWQQAEVIRTIAPGTQPVVAETIEILRRKDKENLVNDRVAWELPGPWRYALREEMGKKKTN